MSTPELPEPLDVIAVGAHPDDVESLYDTTISRFQWQDDHEHFAITVQEEWRGAYVVVWANVDLGYELLHSAPLVVGQLVEPVKKKKRWGIFG